MYLLDFDISAARYPAIDAEPLVKLRDLANFLRAQRLDSQQGHVKIINVKADVRRADADRLIVNGRKRFFGVAKFD